MTEDIDDHSYYYPSDKLVPITPQARRAGFEYEMYITPALWSKAVSWTGQSSKRKTNTDKRIYQLISSCSDGLTKKMAADPEDADGFVYFRFKHFYWQAGRDAAKKKAKTKVGCRLFIHPTTGQPWMLLFDPDYDYAIELEKGPAPDAANDDASSGDGDSASDVRDTGSDAPSTDTDIDVS